MIKKEYIHILSYNISMIKINYNFINLIKMLKERNKYNKYLL